MAFTLDYLIDNVWRNVWRDPILRVLKQRPQGYADIRRALLAMSQEGSSSGGLKDSSGDSSAGQTRRPKGFPADSQITAELAGMKKLGWVDKEFDAGNERKAVWALTEDGKDLVAMLSVIGSAADATSSNDHANVGSRLERKPPSLEQLAERMRRLDASVAHPARRYDYLLGGKSNFAADREAGEWMKEMFPGVVVSVREGRRFLQRVGKFLAAEAKIDQFLDIGTGLPTADNTHEVVQRVNPASRVVYVDNDPMVLSHSRALLTSAPEGQSYYLEEDLRNPEKILGHPDVRKVLDFDRPVALMLIAVLHFIQDDEQARSVVRQLVDALPSGSYLALSHFSVDTFPAEEAAAHHQLAQEGKVDAFARSKSQIADFFTGLEILDPGIVVTSDWRSEVPEDQRPPHKDIAGFGAVARKP